MKANPGKSKQATAETAAVETLTTIADDCEDVLAFFQDIVVKYPRVIAPPLSLCSDKRAHVWFQLWRDVNLPTLPKPSPQDHQGLTVVLTDIATRLHAAEALRPIFVVQRETEKETKWWDRLPPTAQRVILAASATTGTSIQTLPPPTIHRFLNAMNATSLQANWYLTYAGNNIYLPTSLCQALFQGHILAIPDPDAPTVLSPLLTPPYSTVHANAQQRAMQIQFLLSVVQDRLSKEESGGLLNQRVHVLTSTQELCHSTRNFVKLAEDYLGEESPIILSMGLWPLHIDRFDREYNKAFAWGPLFAAELMDRIHKCVQVFLLSCIMTVIEYV